ncbi:MAG: hypothetical protein OEV69_03615 [Gammaproteobacteria bacterium]|nr:hypothetical protein [Gammaproteobacteria bacterium]
MKLTTRILGYTVILACVISAGIAAAGSIDESIANSHRSDANRARDGERKPDQVLAFVGLGAGELVLDWGSGGGYWSELFSGIVGDDGAVFAQQNSGERFDAQKAALTEQYAPFGNIDLLPVERGAKIPLADDSVDTVFLSYLSSHALCSRLRRGISSVVSRHPCRIFPRTEAWRYIYCHRTCCRRRFLAGAKCRLASHAACDGQGRYHGHGV